MTLLILALVVVLAGQTNQSPDPPRLLTAAEFSTAPKAEKRATLNALAGHRLHTSPDEVAYLVEAGLLESDADLRLAAAYAAAGRAAGARFGLDQRFVDRWRMERPVFVRLRPLILKTLTDADPRVRQGAIIALVNMDYEHGSKNQRIRLGDDTVVALSERLNHETDVTVRIELAKTLSLCQPDPRSHDRLIPLLEDALADVVKYAVRGLAESRVAEVLPRVVELLKHRDRGVRLQVAQAMATYGTASIPYLSQLEESLVSESDAVVRQTTYGSIRAIRKAAGDSK